MRTLDREIQEKQWIYMLHQQNPPLTTPTPLEMNSFIPPTPSLPSPHQAYGYVSPAWSQSFTKIPTLPMQFGGMIKVDTKMISTPSITEPLRSLLKKSTSLPTPKSSPKHSVGKRSRDTTDQDVKRPCLPKKCDFPMCQNSSRSRGFCYSHGGGRRCRIEGCANGAVSRDLCKRHGGGRRCRIPECKSSAESGGLCYSHGGGRRCQLSWCLARAKKGGYCNIHIDDPNAPPPSMIPKQEEKKDNEVVESLLCLSKIEPPNEEHISSPTSPLSGLEMTRPYNPYALSCILN